MLLEHIETDLNVQLLFGAALGLVFGIAAQITRFCLRRAVAGEAGPDRAAGAVWVMALATAILGTQLAVLFGYIELSDHRYLNSDVPFVAIAVGGLLFGAGMVLTRGCPGRLTVLAATGNLRAVSVLIVFAIVAHAMMKGVLAPVLTSFNALTLDLPLASLAEISGMAWALPAILLGFALMLARQSGTRALHLALGALIGLMVALGWAGTSVLLMDEFEPSPIQSLAFTLPWTDSLFWTLASTAITPGFGVGLVGGVLLGAFVSAALRGELALQSFATPQDTLRYSAGAVLMGLGGVLAGGCTLGVGLSGTATLSLSAFLGLFAIIAGALITQAIARTSLRRAALA